MLNIGIVGYGIIGNALKVYIEKTKSNSVFSIVDPPKNYNDPLNNVDIIFINIHIPTINNKQDLTLLEEIIAKLPNKPTFIRSTILPGTSEYLSKKYDKGIYFMPEFLTERTAVEDFKNQPMIFTAHEELLKQIFVNKPYIMMSSQEAEITKYAHNVFGALKVTYFNSIYRLCQEENCDYEKVKEGFLLSGYINDMHVTVPGPDGKFGYGGKCFPKDIEAFAHYVNNPLFKKLLNTVIDFNNLVRV